MSIYRIGSNILRLPGGGLSGVPSGGGAWQDVTVGFSGMAAELGGADGRKVRMDLTGTDWGTQLGTGASATRVVGGAYDGTDCIRLVPPTVNDQYSCIMRNLDVSNGGAKDTGQVNLGFCLRYGSRYWDLGHQDKLTGVLASQTVGGTENASASRAAIFEGYKDSGASDFRRIFCITATTVPTYYNPPQGIFPGDGPDADLLMILGTTSNHANNPPLVSTEWMYFEQQVDYRQDAGNADGRNRVDVWAYGGDYLGYIYVPLTWRSEAPEGDPWDFSYRYARLIEYIGGYWNVAGTANANNYLDVSHPIVSLNRPKDNLIGRPPGF